ncbi:hypothetical protein D3C84_1263740 [compost metagenome]
MVQTMMVGRSIGTVMCQKRCQRLAPSRIAASCISCGTDCSAARYITIYQPSPRQSVTNMMAARAKVSSCSQPILVPRM